GRRGYKPSCVQLPAREPVLPVGAAGQPLAAESSSSQHDLRALVSHRHHAGGWAVLVWMPQPDAAFEWIFLLQLPSIWVRLSASKPANLLLSRRPRSLKV